VLTMDRPQNVNDTNSIMSIKRPLTSLIT